MIGYYKNKIYEILRIFAQAKPALPLARSRTTFASLRRALALLAVVVLVKSVEEIQRKLYIQI